MTTLPITTCHTKSGHTKSGHTQQGDTQTGHKPAEAGALSGLIEPLQQLDRRLQQTIEVTQVLCGTAFQQYLLGSIMPAAAPAEVVSAHSALGQLKTNFGLSDFEVSVVVMAIAPELDRRYERLYATLQSTGTRKPTLSLALSMLCSTEAEKQLERKRLLTDSPLKQLLQPLTEQTLVNPGRSAKDSSNYGSERKREDQTLQLKTAVSRYLLNQRSLEPLKQITTYCQLTWPQGKSREIHRSSSNRPFNKDFSNNSQPSQPITKQNPQSVPEGTVSNNPILKALVARIQQKKAPLPLTLQFCRQCPDARQKQQAAEQVAIAAKAPLLRVNLTQLIHTANLNAAQSTLAVEQVVLQGQLWQAVLYLEDTAELPIPMPTFIHPGLIEKLSVQLAHYPGITIFAGSSPHMPEANDGKGILPIPFTDAVPHQHSPKQQSVVSAAQLALNEIEKFRRMLMQSSVEFG